MITKLLWLRSLPHLPPSLFRIYDFHWNLGQFIHHSIVSASSSAPSSCWCQSTLTLRSAGSGWAGARCWAKLALRTPWPFRSVVKSILNKTASVLHNVWVIISFPRNIVTCNDCDWHHWGGDHYISLARDLKVVDCNLTFNGLPATDKISFSNEWLRWESPNTTSL